MKIKTLFDTKWLSIRKMDVPIPGGTSEYIYSHETRCNGKIVSILPFKRTAHGPNEYLLRDEFTPCWSTSENFISSITGGVENDDAFETAMHELKEESGYIVTKKDLVALGTCKGIKSSDTTYYLFAVDLTGREKKEITGDGTYFESKSKCFWGRARDVVKAADPLVSVLYLRLLKNQ